MRGLNKAMVIGSVGREPEMRYTPSGHPVTSFGVATTCSWKGASGEQHEETEWFNVVAWSHLAEMCREQLGKGQRVYVEGRLQTRSWDGHDGMKCYCTELVASDVLVLGGSHEETAAAVGPRAAEQAEIEKGMPQ